VADWIVAPLVGRLILSAGIDSAAIAEHGPDASGFAAKAAGAVE